jgi:PAS domain S-box-containing protein
MDNDLRFLWDAAPIGLAKVSKDGQFLEVNPRYAEMVGYSETELHGMCWQKITHPDDLAADVSEASSLASNGDKRSYQMVKRYLSKDGRTVWVSLYVFSTRDTSGKFQHFLVFAAELTPVSVYPGNTGYQKPEEGKRVTLLEYLKTNPKEAAIVVSAITLLTQGKSLIEVLQSIVSK